MDRALLYARVSKDDTHNEGRNLQGQLDMAREYAQEHGYKVAYELAEDDRGASGADIDLPELQKAIGLARSGKFDVFVVREIDRLSRKLAKQLVVERELEQAGVRIEYVLGEYPDTPEGNFQKHVKAAVAEYEREKIKQRMLRGKRLKIQEGNVLPHGDTPYGYHSDTTKQNGRQNLVINEHEANVIRVMFRWYTQGDEDGDRLSLRGIAEKLTEMGIEKPSGRGGPWGHSTVGNILKNEAYIGKWHWGRSRIVNGEREEQDREDWVTVDVPAIVSKSVFEAAQKRRKENRHLGYWRSKHDYLLSGRVTCSLCGESYRGTANTQDGKEYIYYRHGYRSGCEWKGHFNARKVDEAVWNWVKELLTDPLALEQGLKAEKEERDRLTQPLRQRLDVVHELLEEKRQKLEKLLDLYLDGSFSRDMLVDKKQSLESEIESLEAECDDVKGQLKEQSLTDGQVRDIKEFANKVADGLGVADADFKHRRQIVDLLNVHVRLSREDGEKVVQMSSLLGEALCLVSNSTTPFARRRRPAMWFARRSTTSRAIRRTARSAGITSS
jgi:site-specific DNA recombinase